MKKLLFAVLILFSTTVFSASSEAFIKRQDVIAGSGSTECRVKASIAKWVMDGRMGGYTKEAWLEAYPINPLVLSPEDVTFANRVLDEAFKWEQDPGAFPAYVYNDCNVGKY